MATNIPTIQILSRNNYEVQHLVSLPKAFPLPALATSSIRVKPSILSLTANNLTYGRIGHILGIWQIYPLPPSLPAEYATPNAFGRIAAWGYATVIESNVSSIGPGAQVFGILPIGTLPVDLQVQVNSESRFLEISAQRESVMPLYNQYMFYPPMYLLHHQLFDKTLTYGSDSSDLDLELGLNTNSKVVIVEFGSRGGAGDRWERKLRQTHENVVQLIVAGEVVLESPEKATERFLARTKNDSTVFNTSKAKVQAMEVLGEKRYAEELEQGWKLFKEGELANMKGFEMVWGNGMEAVGKGWDMLCKGEVGADQGLVFSLDL